MINANSLVLRVKHGNNVFIFPGDAYGGTYEVNLLLKHPRERLRATVVVAPDHGFNPGTQFPELNRPEIVVASCQNDYPGNANGPYSSHS